MTISEAQSILRGYRPGTADSQDPEVREALDVAVQNPELQEWVKAQLRLQESIKSEMRDIPVPAGLRDKIISAGKTAQFPDQKKRYPFWLAIAAMIAVLLTTIFYWERPPAEDLSFAGFQNRMASFAVRQYSMDIVTNDVTAVRQYLAGQGTPGDFAIPAGLRQFPVKGGKSTSWQNKPVSMVCFDYTGNTTLYLFVIEAANVENPPEIPAPEPGAFKGKLSTASWRNAGKLYFLAGPISREEMGRIAGSQAALLEDVFQLAASLGLAWGGVGAICLLPNR